MTYLTPLLIPLAVALIACVPVAICEYDRWAERKWRFVPRRRPVNFAKFFDPAESRFTRRERRAFASLLRDDT